jgi:hypothetical protein
MTFERIVAALLLLTGWKIGWSLWRQYPFFALLGAIAAAAFFWFTRG